MPSKQDLPAIDEAQLFADFDLDPLLVSSLASQGITRTFPIQQLTLEVALTGTDIIGQARTGTGKTLAFGLPLLNKINLKKGLQGLVIVPTRELCMQVAQDLTNASADKKIKVSAIYGGVDIDKQIVNLNKGAHVVVGTPGRLIDLLNRGDLSFNSITTLVLDEADEMLNMGFLPDIEKIVAEVNDDRQTLLFSATMPAEIVTLAREYMHKPVIMNAETPEEDTIHERIDQYFFQVHGKDKAALVSRILASKEVKAAVVFCRTKNMVDRLVGTLKSDRLNARAIHSSLNQSAREKTLRQFRNGDITILVATEVAARGLDIDDVTHVINYDMPKEADMYVHRIGRTGRAGRKGIAITLALYDELPLLKTVMDELGIESEVPEMFSTFPELETLFGAPPLKTVKKRTNAYGTVDFDDEEPDELEDVKPTRGRRRKTIKASEVIEAEKAGKSPRRRRRKASQEVEDDFNEFDQIPSRRSNVDDDVDDAFNDDSDSNYDNDSDDSNHGSDSSSDVKPRRSRRGAGAQDTANSQDDGAVEGRRSRGKSKHTDADRNEGDALDSDSGDVVDNTDGQDSDSVQDSDGQDGDRTVEASAKPNRRSRRSRGGASTVVVESQQEDSSESTDGSDDSSDNGSDVHSDDSSNDGANDRSDDGSYDSSDDDVAADGSDSGHAGGRGKADADSKHRGRNGRNNAGRGQRNGSSGKSNGKSQVRGGRSGSRDALYASTDELRGHGKPTLRRQMKITYLP